FTVLAVYSLYRLYRLMKLRGLKTLGIWILLVSAGFWTLEMSIHVKMHADGTRHHLGDNVFINEEPDFGAWLEEAGRSSDEFQAILPIPVFNVGSEKYVSRWQNEPITARAFKMAYNLSLPLACGMMSRTSVDQSNQLVQLLSSGWIEKEIISQYPNDKPILVISQDEVPISWEEQLLLRKTNVIIQKGVFALRELRLDRLSQDPDLLVAQYQALKPALDSLGEGLWATDDSLFYHFERFDQGNPTAFGEETVSSDLGVVELSLFHGKMPQHKYEVSMWVKINHEVAGFPAFLIREFDKDDNMIRDEAHGIMFGMNVYQDWLRFDFEFTPMENSERVHICLYDRKPEAESLLIRP
ncbi:MAG: hypothetical protein AAGM67_17845, partial [Bacteroidota bacterium]